MAGNARRKGRQPLGALVRRGIGPSFRRRGFAHAEIVTRWPAIVGAGLARHVFPERLIAPRGAAGGTLRVRVEGGFATELQHLETEVVERINTYFGYRAVARLAMVQGPLPAPAVTTRRQAGRIDAGEAAALDRALTATEDDRLRASLAALGRGVIARARASE
jgi:hypothetical protein